LTICASTRRRCDAGGLDIKLHACPLKGGERAVGIEPERMAALGWIAGVVDSGRFEAAGLRRQYRRLEAG
jgi:hypothetical protein